jgi:hypothetical protein
MFRTVGRFLFVASIALPSPGARAADTESARRCAEIENDVDRLACYDRLFVPPGSATYAQSSSTAPATDGARSPVGDDAHREFGLSEAQKPAKSTAADSITVTIQSIDRRPTGEQVFRTTEGQVWVELEPSSRVRVEPGATVTIRKAALGSYTLVTSTKVGAKVRRVN